MTSLIATDGWTVAQNGFDPARNRVFESLFSLGNGHLGGRGNHEEKYSGDSLPGNYLAGVFYPDPTRVGWWKNGYPDYFAKVLNAADWKPIHISVDGEPLDLATATIVSFKRVLHMRTGELTRSFRATLGNGVTVDVDTIRFVSIVRKHLGAIRYRITPVDGDVSLVVSAHVNGDVVNEDSNYDEGFWDEVSRSVSGTRGCVVSRTKKTAFDCATAMAYEVRRDGEQLPINPRVGEAERFVASTFDVDAAAGQTIEITKYGANATSREMPADEIVGCCNGELDAALVSGFDALQSEHQAAWGHRWDISDVVIGGDPARATGHPFQHLPAQFDVHRRRSRLEHRAEGIHRREVRRGDLLGHRGVLPAVLPRHE